MNTAHSASTSNDNGSNGASKTSVQHTGDGADHAAERGRDLANQTFDQLAHAVESARKTTVPALEKLTTGAESMAHRSIEMARATSQQMREQATFATEKTVGYVRQEPVKSLLFAAAAGALLAILLSPGKREN